MSENMLCHSQWEALVSVCVCVGGWGGGDSVKI